MACTALADLFQVARQRQIDSQHFKPIAVDHHRSIVAGGGGVEDADQQGGADLPFDGYSPFDVGVERLCPFQDNEGPDLLLGQGRGGLDQSVGNFRPVLGSPGRAKTPPRGELFKRPANILLEDHHQRHQQHC